MNSRERVIAAIHHQAPDRCPIDLGGCTQTGINASALWYLKKTLGMGDAPVKIVEVSQMLGEVTEDVRKWSGTDVVGLFNRNAAYGYKMEGWKPWTLDDGTPVLMPGGFEYDIDAQGNKWVYPQSDRSAPYSACMTKGGSFFDNVDHSEGFDMDLEEGDLTPAEDFRDDFRAMDEEDALYYERETRRLFEETEYAVIGVLGGGSIGDVSGIPGPSVKRPRGIRRIQDWLMAHELFPDYIREVFRYQTDVMLKNLEIYREAVGERIQAVWVSGTDLGTQHSTFLRNETFRALYKPFYREINDWIHQNTSWKTFYHSCGAIYPLLQDLVEMGVDILNPVQCSAAGMEPERLKAEFGDRLVFWGGGVDTQRVLPFGTPDEVEAQVKERIRIFNQDGGFVFSTIHNIVAGVLPENLIRAYETAQGLR
jgi:hypothetical protein